MMAEPQSTPPLEALEARRRLSEELARIDRMLRLIALGKPGVRQLRSELTAARTSLAVTLAADFARQSKAAREALS